MEECEENILSVKWSSDDIYCLLDLYRNNIRNFDIFRKQKVWRSIAEEINTIRDRQFTADQCNGKFKNLKRTYERIREQTETSGNSKKEWEYYEQMHEILQIRPDLTSPANCSTLNYEIITCEEAILSVKWSSGDTQCLLDLYKKNISNFNNYKKNKIWNSIADELNVLRNRQFTGDQCNGKFKNLKRMYYKYKSQIRQNCAEKKTWEYYSKMQELLDDYSDVNTPITCVSQTYENVFDEEMNDDSNFGKKYNFYDYVEELPNAAATSSVRKRKNIASQSSEERKLRILEESLVQKRRYNDLLERYLILLENKNT